MLYRSTNKKLRMNRYLLEISRGIGLSFKSKKLVIVGKFPRRPTCPLNNWIFWWFLLIYLSSFSHSGRPEHLWYRGSGELSICVILAAVPSLCLVSRERCNLGLQLQSMRQGATKLCSTCLLIQKIHTTWASTNSYNFLSQLG